MRTRALIEGLRNNQRIRVIVEGVGFQSTVKEVADGMCFAYQRQAVISALALLGRSQSATVNRPTGFGSRLTVYTAVGERREVDVQVDLVD